MRKILIRLAIVIVVLVSLSILWLTVGRQISAVIDRFKTVETRSASIKSIVYEGNGNGGILRVDDLELSLNPSRPGESQVSVGTTKDNQLALSFTGKVFPFGPLQTTSEGENLAANIPPGDQATISIRHSAVAWPTPFDFNFMTGQSPTWRRHLYYKINWEKSDGQKLEMLWRYEEYFYSGNGWMNAPMSRENSTGLIRVEISSATR